MTFDLIRSTIGLYCYCIEEIQGVRLMRNISKILMCLLVGTSLASCTGSTIWLSKQEQSTVNSYLEKRVNDGKYDLQGLCDRIREAEFHSAASPSNVTFASTARKTRKAFEFIAEKKRSDVKCPEPTANEIRVHLYRAERMSADRKKAFEGLGQALGAGAAAAMGYKGGSSSTRSSNSDRLDELERKQKEDKFWREYNCPNDMWRKGYCWVI